MAKTPTTPWRMLPLQKAIAEPITDPAEQAALDEKRRRHRKAAPAAGPRKRRPTREAKETAVAGLLRLARQLAPEDRRMLLTKLAAQLPPDAELELLGQALVQLPLDALDRLAEELRARIGPCSA
jgi:hypothetical protein